MIETSLIRSVLSAADLSAAGTEGWRLAPNTLLVLVNDGTARLVDLTGDFYALDIIGARMVEATLRRGIDGAVRELADEPGANPDFVAADLDEFLQTLKGRGLLHSGATPACHRSGVTARVFAALAAILITNRRRSIRARTWIALTAAYVSTRVFGWGPTIQAWTTTRRLASPAPYAIPSPEQTASALDKIDAAIRHVASHHPLNMECKERALGALALARSARLPACVVLGISLFPLSLHVWAESGSRIVGDQRDSSCDRYTPLTSFR